MAGKTQVSTSLLICEDGSAGELDEILKGTSVFVVEPVRSPAAQSVTQGEIYTWHVVRVLEVLSLGSAATHDRCQPPSDLTVAPDELAIPALHGTTVIDGISVTMHSNRSFYLDAGQRYLVIAKRCGTDVATLPQGPRNIFGIDDHGRVLAIPEQYPASFREEMIAIGTVSGLARRLRRAQANAFKTAAAD